MAAAPAAPVVGPEPAAVAAPAPTASSTIGSDIAPATTLAFTGPPGYVRLAPWLALALLLVGGLMVLWARRPYAGDSATG
ncbi:MAG TPA: hypothetical protein VFW24_18485 [Acidimicrobiales bacterium]|nr:hypothetical protein [Acidimicrobiales bacterium]